MNVQKTKSSLFVMFLLLTFGFIQAQEKKQLTLKEAIDLSVSHSPNLKLSTAKIAEADAALKIAKENKLPEASVSGSHIRLNNPNIDLKSASNSGGGSGGGGATQEVSVHSATYGILNVSLPLYAGGKIRYGIESSRYLAEASKLDAVTDRDAIVINTINAYTNFYKASAAVKVVKESVEGNRERVRQFTNLEKEGLLARNDLLKAKLQESNTELTLAEAENNLKLANANMNIMLGLGDSTIIELTEAGWDFDSKGKTIEDFQQMALQNRKDVEAVNLRNKAAKTGINIAKA
ncbi:MAG: TolC family protein, partial [Flavitalea sp.]